MKPLGASTCRIMISMALWAAFCPSAIAALELPFGELECSKINGIWTADTRLPDPGVYCLVPEARKRCIARGAEWTLVRPDKIGCKSTDARKPCTAESQCQIACLAPRDVK